MASRWQCSCKTLWHQCHVHRQVGLALKAQPKPTKNNVATNIRSAPLGTRHFKAKRSQRLSLYSLSPNPCRPQSTAQHRQGPGPCKAERPQIPTHSSRVETSQGNRPPGLPAARNRVAVSAAKAKGQGRGQKRSREINTLKLPQTLPSARLQAYIDRGLIAQTCIKKARLDNPPEDHPGGPSITAICPGVGIHSIFPP